MAITPTTASSSTAFNVDGIVSGLKTADIIAQMMKLSQAPLNQLTAQQTAVQHRDDAYQAISSQMILFRSSVQNLLLSNAVNAKLAVSSAPAVATAVANSSAINGSFSLTVAKLATATVATSNGTVGVGANLGSGAPVISSLMSVVPTPGTFTINGTSVTLAPGDSWQMVKDNISVATGGNLVPPARGAVTLNLLSNGVSLTSDSSIQIGAVSDTSNFLGATQLLGAAQTGSTGAYAIGSSQLLGETKSGDPLSTAGLNVAGGIAAAGSFKVNGVAIAWSNSDSLSNILGRINSSSAGVTATYDPKQDKVSLTNSGTGAQSISLQDTTGNLLTALHLTEVPDPALLSLNPATAMSASGLATPPTAGTFTINGTQVTVGANDTWSTVQSAIAATGVTLNIGGGVAPSLTPGTPGAPIHLGSTGLPADTSNFFKALGFASTTQVAGTAAEYTTTQNGVTSATQFSNSNTVNGIVPGVNLTLLATSATGVTISTTQDVGAATTNLQAFVTQFNSMVDLLDTSTKYDSVTGKGAVLAGDSSITGLANQLRSMVAQAGLVPGGSAYRTMGDIGISTGAFGAALGSTNHLILDTSKLTAALQNNPQAVSQVLNGLTGTTSIGASHNWMATSTGTPYGQVTSGTYAVTFNPSAPNPIKGQPNILNQLTSVFTSSNGTIQPATTSTITAGGTNTSLIPGVLLVANGVLPGTTGIDTVNYTVTGRGILQTVSDYLNQSRSSTGIFASEHNDATSSIASFSAQIARQNQMLAQRQTTLQAQFTAMEVALSKLQSQSSSLSSSISSLSNSQSSSSGS